MEKIKYVVGFMFNENETDVLLIKKNKPAWQKGKMNGVGGKIEKGEYAMDAMHREFKEETGIDFDQWKYIVTMSGDDWECHVFTGSSDDVFDFKQMEDEVLHLIPLREFDDFDLISNLYWLVPMCLDKNDDHKSGINYHVSNKYHHVT